MSVRKKAKVRYAERSRTKYHEFIFKYNYGVFKYTDVKGSIDLSQRRKRTMIRLGRKVRIQLREARRKGRRALYGKS